MAGHPAGQIDARGRMGETPTAPSVWGSAGAGETAPVSEPEGLGWGHGVKPGVPFSKEGISCKGTKRRGLDRVSVAKAKPQPHRSSGCLAQASGCLRSLTAVGLILAVFTVVLLVTRPTHGDAAPTGAGEVVQGASGALHTWGRGRREGTATSGVRCPPHTCPLARPGQSRSSL